MRLARSWRERSRAFRIVAMTAGGLAAAAAILWLARVPIAQWAIERGIDGFGLGPAKVEITALGPSRAEMTLVSSGAGTIRRIRAEYGLLSLLGGHVDHVTVDGARIAFAWKDGKLAPAITPSDGPIRLPVDRIDIADSSLTLDAGGQRIVASLAGAVTGGGPITADLALGIRAPQGRLGGRVKGVMKPDGALQGTFTVSGGDVAVGTVKASGLSGALRLAASASSLDAVDADFSFSDIASGATPLGPGRMTAALHQPENVLTVSLDSRPLAFSLRADGGKPASGVPFTADGHASAAFLGGLAGAAKDAGGTFTIKATGTAPPAASMQAAFAAGLGDWLAAGALQAALDGGMTGLDLPGIATVDDATLSLDIRLADGALSVATPRGIVIGGLRLDKELAAADSLFAGKSSLSVAPAPGAPFLSITPREGGTDTLAVSGGVSYMAPSLSVRGQVDGEATLDPAQWRTAASDVPATGQARLKARLALKLPEGRSLPAAELTAGGSYDIGPAAIRLTADHGALTLRDVRWGESLALPGMSTAVLQPGASYAMDRATGAVTASAVLRPFTWQATMKHEGAPPAAVTLAASRMALDMDKDGLKAVLDKARVEMPGAGVAARGISATVTRTAGATSLKAAVADLRGTGEPALFSPLKATLDARLAGSKASFTAALTGAGKRLSLVARGTHDLDSGKGGASVTLKPLDLAGDGTVAALSPRLAASIGKASGTVSGDGAIHWGDGAAPGTLTLALKDVAIAGASVNVSGLTGGVRLDSLSPLRSAPGQHVSGALQLPTVDQVPFDVSFRLAPGKLVLERATAKVFDGQFETENAEIDTATGNGRFDLKVSDINLGTAFKVLDLEQLKGTGRIGGVLPLRIEGGKVAVEKGHLETSVPGTLQVGVGALADQLKSYGENVDLAFRALTDFHYNRMSIDAEKPLSGTGKAIFHLDGNNPAVMDAQPFVFNISLETDFDYLTQLLLELSGAANTALGWGARELTKK